MCLECLHIVQAAIAGATIATPFVIKKLKSKTCDSSEKTVDLNKREISLEKEVIG